MQLLRLSTSRLTCHKCVGMKTRQQGFEVRCDKRTQHTQTQDRRPNTQEMKNGVCLRHVTLSKRGAPTCSPDSILRKRASERDQRSYASRDTRAETPRGRPATLRNPTPWANALLTRGAKGSLGACSACPHPGTILRNRCAEARQDARHASGPLCRNDNAASKPHTRLTSDLLGQVGISLKHAEAQSAMSELKWQNA